MTVSACRYLSILLTSLALILTGCDESRAPAPGPITDVSDSSDVSDTSDQSDASNSGDPSDLTDSSDPSDASDPSNSESDASDQTDATDPSESSDMSDPSDESDGSQVNDPTDSNANDALQGQWTQTFGTETLRLTLTQDGHLRVERFPTTAGAYPDRGWTVAEDWQWPQGQLNFDDAGNAWVLETERWALSVNKNNGLLSFDTDSGEMYRELDYQIDSPRLNVVLDDRDHFVALGEKTGGLDKRGEELTMWTTDAINPEDGILPWTDPIYQSHHSSLPFETEMRSASTFKILFAQSSTSVKINQRSSSVLKLAHSTMF